MGLISWFRRAVSEAAERGGVRAMAGEAAQFNGLNDPLLVDFLRGGTGAVTEAGLTISPKVAMRNTTVFRCVSLISFAIGMLPLHLQHRADKRKAVEHPLYRILYRKPNAWQTGFEFRSLMQQRALIHGDSYAMVVRSGSRPLQLVPLDPGRVRVEQNADWSLRYRVERVNNGPLLLGQNDVFHLRYGISEDGITGVSLVRQAAEAIALAIQTDKAAARLFRQGMLVGGALKHPNRLSEEAYHRLRASMEERESAENAHKWLITEEGMEAQPFSNSGRDNQHLETRRHQIEEIGRPFGVPRPLLGLDETSWGSGIDVLGQFFVRYALNPWFDAWQQAIERDLLTDAEAERYQARFNAGVLLRGNMKDQAQFFATGLGAGGHQPFLEVEEVRDWLDLGPSDNLPPAAGQGPRQERDDEPTQAS